LKAAIKGLEDILKIQGEVLTEIKLGGSGGKGQTILQVVEANKEQLKASTKKGKEHEFEIKADTLRASVVGNPNALDLTDIGQLAHRKLTVYDMFRKVPVPKDNNGVVRYVDWDPATTVRAAAAKAEGADFPSSTAKWATYTLSLEKVGDSIPMSEEMLYDSALFAAELENFLRVNVAIKIDTDLITANGSTPNINGLNNQLTAYTPVASGIVDASLYDLLVKVREAITASYGSKYNPNVALMNITDINRMKLKKDQNNNYILPPFFDKAGNVVDGITVVECNAITANTAAVGDSRYGAIYEEPGVTVQTGFATGDFESDMMTIKARKRLNLLIRNVDRTGWLKVTDIDAALVILAS
jgi:HK97 family phage major capsid protein